MKNCIFSLMLILGSCLSAAAQGRFPTTHQVTGAGDMQPENVNRIFRDSRGLLWLATDHGAYCYQGKESFPIIFADPVSNTETNAVLETSDHALYMTTVGGVYRIDLASLACHRAFPKIRSAYCLIEDDGTLLVGADQGIYHCNSDGSCRLRQLEQNPMSQDNRVIDIIRCIGRHQYWLCGLRHLVHYDSRTGAMRKHDLSGHFGAGGLSHICRVGEKVYVGTTNSGLLCFDTRSNRAESLNHVAVNNVKDLFFDGHHTLYVCGEGIIPIDTRTNQVTEDAKLSALVDKLPTASVYTYYYDRQLNVSFAGLFIEGLVHEYHHRPLFRTYRYGTLDTGTLHVRSFCIHGDDMVIGTREGFYHVNERRHHVAYFPEGVSGLKVVTNVCYFGGRFVLSSFDNGVRTYDPETGRITHLADDRGLRSGSFARLAVTRDSTRLFVCGNPGIYVFDSELRMVHHFDDKNSGLPDGYIPGLFFDRGNKGWIAMLDRLCIYDPVSGTIHSNNFPEGYFNLTPQLSFNEAYDGDVLAFNSEHVYKSSIDLSHYDELPFVQRNHVSGISFIRQVGDHYWVGSNNGLLIYDRDFERYTQLGITEGLPGTLFNKQEFQRTADGTLWMATTNGLAFITPEAQSHVGDSVPGRVILSRLMIDQREKPQGEHLEMIDEPRIRLTWNFGSEELAFIPHILDYSNDHGRAYEWQIDDDEWQTTLSDQLVLTPHLSLGTHTLRMRIAGHPETVSAYSITVWPSRVFWLELAFVILLTLYLWQLRRNYQRRRQRKRFYQIRHEQQLRQAVDEVLKQKQEAEEEERQEKHRLMQQRASTREFRELARRTRELMELKCPYRQQSYRLSDLAGALDSSPTMLSLMFNQTLDTNFNDYINTYRLQEFKRLVADKRNANISTLAIAERCGFKKTSFFNSFKKIEGCTPKEWIAREHPKNNTV